MIHNSTILNETYASYRKSECKKYAEFHANYLSTYCFLSVVTKAKLQKAVTTHKKTSSLRISPSFYHLPSIWEEEESNLEKCERLSLTEN